MAVEIFMKNVLRQSELGLGDGTVYTFASGAIVNQADSTFSLTGSGLGALVGPTSDDIMNGYILYFPASGNKYHIVNWVDSTAIATTLEVPDLQDTGPSEIRRSLFDNKSLASNPLLYAADGQRHKKWKRSILGDIIVSLPNMLKANSGFEAGDLSSWLVFAGSPTINSASPILGKYDVSMPIGARLWHLMRGPFKERTYRLLFKARASVWNDSLGVVLVSKGGQHNPNYSLSGNSSGSINGITWSPGLTTSNAWHWVDFTINTLNKGDIYVTFNNNQGTQQPFSMDEVYCFEKVNVNSYLVLDETDSEGTVPTITGYYAPDDRAGISGTDNTILLNSAIKHHNVSTFTGGVFPIYKITFGGIAPSGSEVLLSESWTWQFNPDMPFDSENIGYTEKTIKTRSGVESIIRHSKKRKVKGLYSKIPTTERDILKNDFFPHHIDEERHPFAYRLNSTDTPLFVRVSKSSFGLNRSSGLLDDWDFAFDEVL